MNPSGTSVVEVEELRQLLLRGWMTHDAMWFANALSECGIDVANRLNRGAIRAMAPLEVRRLQAALGIERIEGFADLEAFVRGAIQLLTGDFMDFRWDWRPPDGLQVRVHECFAHKGIARLGAIDRYQCGIFYRIFAWLDVLGVEYQVAPRVEHCTMHHDGTCVRDLSFSPR